ncbi:MAG: hypothetical protein GC129_00780 [Proteobacteria bacterium]|nr:hypothetical protein [Pseudomonadota bacterium]
MVFMAAAAGLPQAWAVDVETSQSKSEALKAEAQACREATEKAAEDSKRDAYAAQSQSQLPTCVKWWKMITTDVVRARSQGMEVSSDPATGTITYVPQPPKSGIYVDEDDLDYDLIDDDGKLLGRVMSQ